MALEREVKLRVTAHNPVRQRLSVLGATCLGRVLETNIILDRPDGWLQAKGCGLRLRSARVEAGQPPTATLTAKGPRLPGPMKTREEFEIVVSDVDTASRLLETLGFVPVLTYEKRRESWEYGGCRVELDEPPHIGLFVEIEGPNEESIQTVQRELNLAELPAIQASYVRMLNKYCDDHAILPRMLALP